MNTHRTPPHIHLGLGLLLALLAACQPASQTLQTPNSNLPVKSQSHPQLLEPANFSARARVQSTPQGTRFLISLSQLNDSGFQTENLACGAISVLNLKVTGIGITPAISATATPTSVGSCEFTTPTSLNTIPVGKARIVSVTANDGANDLATIKAPVEVTASQNSTFEISYRSHVSARILEELMATGVSGQVLASKLNLTDLQNWVDFLIGKSGSFPNFSYTNHPLLLNPIVLATAILNNNGVIPTTSPANYLVAPATLQLTVLNANPVPLTVSLRDPATSPQFVSTPGTNEVFTFSNIIPGLWKLRIGNGGITNQNLNFNPGENKILNLDLAAPAPTLPTPNWNQITGGPYAGTIRRMARDSSGRILLATEGGGIFVTTNAGNNWVEANEGLSTLNVTALGSNPADGSEPMYLGTQDGKVFKRNFVQGDTNWTQVGSSEVTPGKAPINMLYVDPGNPHRLYAGGYFEGIFECLDTTSPVWTAVNLGLGTATTFPVSAMVKDTSDNKYYLAFKGAGIFKSNVANAPGSGWADISSPLTGGDLYISGLNLSQINNRLQIGTLAGNFFFNNTLLAPNWINSSVGITSGSNQVLNIVSQAGVIYAATRQGLKKAVDTTPNFGEPDGAWTQAKGPGTLPQPNDNPPNPFLGPIMFDPTVSNAVLAGSDGAGVSQWDNDSNSWNYRNAGLLAAQISDMLKAPGSNSQLFVATRGGGVYHSNDNGTNWGPMQNVQIPATGPERAVTSLEIRNQAVPANTYDLFMGTDGEGVFYLDDAIDGMADSSPWTPLNPAGLGINKNVRALLKLPSDMLLAGTNTGLFEICAPGSSTCTSPSTWQQINSGTITEGISLATKPGSVRHVYVGGIMKVYVNADIAIPAGWNTVAVGISGQKVSSLATSVANPAVVYAGLFGFPSNASVYKSTNSGTSFTAAGNLPASVKEVFTVLADQSNANIVYVGTNDGVYGSVDGGSTWTAFNAGGNPLTNISITKLYLIGTNLYAGSAGRSLFLCDLNPPLG